MVRRENETSLSHVAKVSLSLSHIPLLNYSLQALK